MRVSLCVIILCECEYVLNIFIFSLRPQWLWCLTSLWCCSSFLPSSAWTCTAERTAASTFSAALSGSTQTLTLLKDSNFPIKFCKLSRIFWNFWKCNFWTVSRNVLEIFSPLAPIALWAARQLTAPLHCGHPELESRIEDLSWSRSLSPSPTPTLLPVSSDLSYHNKALSKINTLSLILFNLASFNLFMQIVYL